MILALALAGASGGCTAISVGNSPPEFNAGLKAAKATADEAFVTRVFITPEGRFLQPGVEGQDFDLDELAGKISADCADDRTLIILIHGFNITGPEAGRAYKLARIQLQRLYPDRKFAFLEVYWNGLYGDPLACWPQAMVNSKWTGLGLRTMLNRIDGRIPVRVLTHSRGAAVICSALWNTSMRGKASEDTRYEALQKTLPLPKFADLRIGLIAPAIRTVEFETYVSPSPNDRVVLGINPDDAALKSGGLSWMSGSALGHRPDQAKNEVLPRLNRDRAVGFMVDFSGCETHSFLEYLMRDEFEGEFLTLLLGERRGAEIVTRSQTP